MLDCHAIKMKGGLKTTKTVKDGVCECECSSRQLQTKKNGKRKPKTATIARTDPQYYQHLHRVYNNFTSKFYYSLNKKTSIFVTNVINNLQLRTIQHVIDNSPPNLPLEVAMKCDNATNDYKHLLQRQEDNKTMLKAINYIQRTEAKCDNYNPMAGVRLSNLHKVHMDLERTEKENKVIHSRLQLIVKSN